MTCPNPQCRGREFRLIAPGHVECVSIIEEYFDAGGGQVGMATRMCRTRYSTGTSSWNFGVCRDCATGAVRTCHDCRAPLCGDCSSYVNDSGHASPGDRTWACVRCVAQRQQASRQEHRRCVEAEIARYRALPAVQEPQLRSYLDGGLQFEDGKDRQLWEWTCADVGRILSDLGISTPLELGSGSYGGQFTRVYPSGRVEIRRGERLDGDTGKTISPAGRLAVIDGVERFNQHIGADIYEPLTNVYLARFRGLREAIAAKRRRDEREATKRAAIWREDMRRRIKIALFLAIFLFLTGSLASALLSVPSR